MTSNRRTGKAFTLIECLTAVAILGVLAALLSTGVSFGRFADVNLSDSSLLPTRLKLAWPSKLSDPTISTRPILSDWMTGSKEPMGNSFVTASGAHPFAGKIRNGNSAYADGHVVTQSPKSMKWELKLTDSEDAYIFY